MAEKSRFTSDRRVPSSSTWVGDSDWAAGVAEDVDVVDGRLVGRPPIQHSESPDSGMFQSPIYQFWAGDYGGNDGDSPFSSPEVLGGLSDASVVGGPIFRTDQNGFAASEYDGTDDAHDYTADSQYPTGQSALTFAALVYPTNTSGRNDVVFGGGLNDCEAFQLAIKDGQVRADLGYAGTGVGGSVTTGAWQTIGGVVESDGTCRAMYNGSEVASGTGTAPSLTNENQSIAYRGAFTDNYYDGYVAEVIVSATAETESAFSDYHQDRLG